MSELQLIILVIVIHYLADFALQTDDQAKLKGEKEKKVFIFYNGFTNKVGLPHRDDVIKKI